MYKEIKCMKFKNLKHERDTISMPPITFRRGMTFLCPLYGTRTNNKSVIAVKKKNTKQ